MFRIYNTIQRSIYLLSISRYILYICLGYIIQYRDPSIYYLYLDIYYIYVLDILYICLGYIIQYTNYTMNVPTALQGIKSKIYLSNKTGHQNQ